MRKKTIIAIAATLSLTLLLAACADFGAKDDAEDVDSEIASEDENNAENGDADNKSTENDSGNLVILDGQDADTEDDENSDVDSVTETDAEDVDKADTDVDGDAKDSADNDSSAAENADNDYPEITALSRAMTDAELQSGVQYALNAIADDAGTDAYLMGAEKTDGYSQ